MTRPTIELAVQAEFRLVCYLPVEQELTMAGVILGSGEWANPLHSTRKLIRLLSELFKLIQYLLPQVFKIRVHG